MDNNDNISVLVTSIIILLITIAVILLWDKAQNMDSSLIKEIENSKTAQPAD